jgi:hypothetical protein
MCCTATSWTATKTVVDSAATQHASTLSSPTSPQLPSATMPLFMTVHCHLTFRSGQTMVMPNWYAARATMMQQQ